MIIQLPHARPFVVGDSLDFGAPLVWTLDNVLNANECQQLIDRIEAAGPSAATITTARGFEHRPEIRNNTRVMIDDAALAADLFGRVRHAVPPALHGGWHPVGANERLRCYRYTVGQKFALHYDGAFIRNGDEESLLTFMVYLNAGFDGGTTDFPDLDVRVVPAIGRALFFQHRQLHEGKPVERGVKYVIRSDVMYRRGG